MGLSISFLSIHSSMPSSVSNFLNLEARLGCMFLNYYPDCNPFTYQILPLKHFINPLFKSTVDVWKVTYIYTLRIWTTWPQTSIYYWHINSPKWRSGWETRLASVCLIQPAWLELTLGLVQLAWILAPVCHNLAVQMLKTCLGASAYFWSSLKLWIKVFGQEIWSTFSWSKEKCALASFMHKQVIRIHEFPVIWFCYS